MFSLCLRVLKHSELWKRLYGFYLPLSATPPLPMKQTTSLGNSVFIVLVLEFSVRHL